mgnify:CR=1 FL=1|tara:strand:+ start:310 stop:975 length:666 start_codon:yes stop_codon:yes gene_type:complete
MKKFFIIFIVNLMLLTSIAHGLDLKSGHMIKDAAGNKLYWHPYQKKYVSCDEFIRTGNTIDPDLVKGLEGVTPVCEGWIFGDGKDELEEFFKSSDTNISNKNSGDVKGKKLFCYWRNDRDISGFGIEFNRNNKVKLRAIDEDNEKLITINGKYQALSDKIIIEYKNLDKSDTDLTINRKTLKINYASRSSCKTIKKSSFIETKLEIALDKFISEKSSENKF